MKKEDEVTLHRYFIWVDRMRVHYDEALKIRNKETPLDIDCLMYMSLWYGMMYVVIEGWKELELNDTRIDKLLLSKNVDLHRKYRNGTFHFRKDYFDIKRFLPFIESSDSAKWIRELREAFSEYFLAFIKNHQGSQ